MIPSWIYLGRQKCSWSAAVCLSLSLSSMAWGQVRAQPATTPAVGVFPPAPTINQLNNGSLATWVNPNGGLPGQLLTSNIASVGQDLRLIHNGIPVDARRLIDAADGFPATVNTPAGLITINDADRLNPYIVQGAGARRPPYPARPLARPSQPYYPYAYPVPPLAYYRPLPMPVPVAVPTPTGGTYFDNTSGYRPGGGSFNPAAANRASYGAFGGEQNPFDREAVAKEANPDEGK
jgi:hypothetical protein